MPGKTTKPESIRPGFRTFCSTCESAVSQEVLAPFGVARSLSFLNRVDTAGRARGLSGAPDGARGRGSRTEAFIALILMGGWCSRKLTPTRMKGRPRGNGQKCCLVESPFELAMEVVESCYAPSNSSNSHDDETRLQVCRFGQPDHRIPA